LQLLRLLRGAIGSIVTMQMLLQLRPATGALLLSMVHLLHLLLLLWHRKSALSNISATAWIYTFNH
jgi:hypothetical protein